MLIRIIELLNCTTTTYLLNSSPHIININTACLPNSQLSCLLIKIHSPRLAVQLVVSRQQDALQFQLRVQQQNSIVVAVSHKDASIDIQRQVTRPVELMRTVTTQSTKHTKDSTFTVQLNNLTTHELQSH